MKLLSLLSILFLLFVFVIGFLLTRKISFWLLVAVLIILILKRRSK